MMTRIQGVRAIASLDMLRSGYPHIYRMMVPSRRKSWQWRATEFDLLTQSTWKQLEPQFTDLFFRQPLASIMQANLGAYDGGTFIQESIVYR